MIYLPFGVGLGWDAGLAPTASSLEARSCPDGEIGRRKGLKIPRGQPRAGSTPAPGTIVFPGVPPIPVRKSLHIFFPQFPITSAIFYFVGFTFLPFRSRM